MSLLVPTQCVRSADIVALPQHSATHRYGMCTMFARLLGTRGLGVFETCAPVACSGAALPHGLIGMRRIARQSATAPIRTCANARILSMQAMFGLAFDASVALGSSECPCSVRAPECFIAGFFGKRPRSFVLCFRYSTMVITAIFERGTHARRSYQARRGI